MVVSKAGSFKVKISVIIPCYNVQEYVAECLQSVYSQTVPAAEVICVDNNSSDQTSAVLKELKAALYPDLIILSDSNAGANYARNTGLHAATSPWIQFLDADDLLMPTKFENQSGLITKGNYSFIAAAYISRNAEGRDKIVNRIHTNQYVAPFINQCGITSSNLWNREVLLAAGGWNTSLKSSQEAELMMRLVLRNENIQTDENPLTIIRARGEGQISQSDPTRRYIRFLEVRANYLNQLKLQQANRYAENRQQLLTYFISNLLILLNYNPEAAGQFSHRINWKEWRPAAGFGMSYFKAVLIKLLGWPAYARLNKLRP